MGTYVLYRLASAAPVVFGVTLIVFFMVRLVPGDPVDVILANQHSVTEERRAQVRHQLGLDQSLPQQYVTFLTRALRGDLGESFRTRRPVVDEILIRLPNTLRLTIASLVITVVVGVTAGVVAASNRGTLVDLFTTVAAIVAVSVPGFWLGLIFILVFAVQFGWLPVAGADSWKHLVLPAFTLGLRSSALVARVTRSSMLDSLDQDYVRTARAKGLRERSVVYRHALRNALIPVATILGFEVGGLLTGAFIIEEVFAFPGVGLMAVQAISNRDFPAVQGVVIFVALIYISVNFAVDLIYGLLDPRVRYDS